MSITSFCIVKEPERKEIQAQVEAFLASGGAVEQIPIDKHKPDTSEYNSRITKGARYADDV